MRETTGWDRIRVQLDSGAIDTVSPKEIAKGFEMKETIMTWRGVGFVAANGIGIDKDGEKMITGYAEDGEGVRSEDSVRMRRRRWDRCTR